ncbi:LysR family transcriptional regulator [Afipia sp. DC4300-2b1]|uniref:LysR family transcriptional regulator n=1 Tax=Afipia sp. DC4300-2b1 TaxID=2804672 RepID=UPI003CF90E97
MIRGTELVTLIQTLAAAEQGSFSKAGQQCSVPASTISRRVRALETQIGVKLFTRHRHGLRRTVAGEGFIAEIRRVLNDLNLVLVNTSASRRGHSGSLRIGLSVSPWRGRLRAALAAYRDRFPAVQIQYTDGERKDLMKRLDAGAIDIAIVADHTRHGSHEVMALWRENILVAMPRSHPLAGKRPLAWDDLRKEHVILGRDPGPDLGELLLHKLNRTGPMPTIHHHNIGHDFSLSLIGLGHDVTLVYESDASTEHSSIVYRLLTDGHTPSLVPFFACWMPHNDNPALRTFLDTLREPMTDRSDPVTIGAIDRLRTGRSSAPFGTRDPSP